MVCVLGLVVSFQGRSSDFECDGVFSKTQSGHLVWPAISAREYDEYRVYLEPFSAPNLLEGRHGNRLPVFDEDSIIRGKKSILSLGEGAAQYISTLIAKRLTLLPEGAQVDNIHAVDMAYKDPWENLKGQPNALTKFAVIAKHIVEFQNNYHFGLFHTMDLRDRASNRLVFDEMISLMSLGSVLSSHSSLFDQSYLTLRNIFDHLKPGGVLRLVGGNSLGSLLDKLVVEGIVKDYAILEASWINIQKR